MQKLTLTFNATWMLAIVFSFVSVQGMEEENKKRSPEEYEQLVLQAEEYNQHNPLFLLVNDILGYIFSQDNGQAKSIENSIKTFVKLSTVCKYFNTLLTCEIIGNLCKNYALVDKTQALQNVMEAIHYGNYKTERLPVLILVSAGADVKNNFNVSLLEKATFKNDIQLVKILFQHHVDPNAGALETPILFYAKTVQMVQLFIDNGVNVHATDSGKHTILCNVAEDNKYPSELMELYLKYGVDATKLHPWDNSCLLHVLGKPLCYVIRNVDDFLKKGELLLDVIPDMINVLNQKGQTPMDVVQESLEIAKEYGTPEAFEKLITLYRKRGCLTVQELVAQKIV